MRRLAVQFAAVLVLIGCLAAAGCADRVSRTDTTPTEPTASDPGTAVPTATTGTDGRPLELEIRVSPEVVDAGAPIEIEVITAPTGIVSIVLELPAGSVRQLEERSIGPSALERWTSIIPPNTSPGTGTVRVSVTLPGRTLTGEAHFEIQ